jgi:hypothetical protein
VKGAKERARATVKQTFRPEESRFQQWDTNVLRELLVFHDVELRGANRAPHTFVVKVCDEVFKDQPLPKPPPSRSFEDMVRLDACALRIQHIYFKKKSAAIEAAYQKAHVQNNRRLQAGIEPDLMEHTTGTFDATQTMDHSRANLLTLLCARFARFARLLRSLRSRRAARVDVQLVPRAPRLHHRAPGAGGGVHDVEGLGAPHR